MELATAKTVLQQHLEAAELSQLVELGRGASSIAFGPPEDTPGLIFLFPQSPWALRSLHQACTFLPHLQQHLLSQGCPVLTPCIKHNSLKAPTPFISYPKLLGVPIGAQRFQKLSPSTQKIVAASLLSFVHAVHSFPVTQAKALGLPTTSFKDKYTRELIKLEAIKDNLPSGTYTHLHQQFSAYAHTPPAFTPTVIHGDLNGNNLFFHPGSKALSGVIDFGDLQISHPLADLSRLSARYGPRFLQLATQLYPHQYPSISALASELDFFALAQRFHRYHKALTTQDPKTPQYFAELLPTSTCIDKL